MKPLYIYLSPERENVRDREGKAKQERYMRRIHRRRNKEEEDKIAKFSVLCIVQCWNIKCLSLVFAVPLFLKERWNENSDWQKQLLMGHPHSLDVKMLPINHSILVQVQLGSFPSNISWPASISKSVCTIIIICLLWFIG